MTCKSIYDLLSDLTPYDVLGCAKVRIGSPNDGGYVMLDLFRPSQAVFSYGLSWNIAFEEEFARRGHTLFMFDHTIEGLTVQHPGFRWFKEGLGAVSAPKRRLFSLADHVARLAPAGTGMILKLDIEGAEWDALAALPAELLGRFDQIVIELHDLRRAGEPAWCSRAKQVLHKLAQMFTVHHVHANNHAPVAVVGNMFTVADVIEVSYVRRDLVARCRSSTLLPSFLDAPNDPGRPEIPLWFFPFMPTGPLGGEGAVAEAQGGAIARFEAALLHARPSL